jgi:Mycothiol maleylpyruvate isomerase N-terminal domain.
VDTVAHDELTARETEAWASFEAVVNAVPRERRSEPSLPEGWSVKDVLWHVAFWWDECAATLERIRVGSQDIDESGDTDEINAGVLEASRSMSLEDVETGMARIRERMLSAWDQISGDPSEDASDDAAANEAFSSESIDHYDDHLADLRALSTP